MERDVLLLYDEAKHAILYRLWTFAFWACAEIGDSQNE